MNDSQLNEILKRGSVPEPGEDFWDRFPKRVTAQIHWRIGREARGDSDPVGRLGLLIFEKVFAAMCLVAVLGLLFWNGRDSNADRKQVAQAQKYFHELEALFPNQLESIVFDADGPHLRLAARPNIPAAKGLYLKVCGPKGCKSYVTFSGQQIYVDGNACDVLMDHRGNVLLVGGTLAWSSAGVANAGVYRVQARVLERAS